MNTDIFSFNHIDDRKPKHGWWSGMYICRCRNCDKAFTGAKGSWTCSSCAYVFDVQLTYEQLWRDLGWPYTSEYITKKPFNNKEGL